MGRGDQEPELPFVTRALGWLLTICGIIWGVWGLAHSFAGLLMGIEGAEAHGLAAFAPMFGALLVTAIAAAASWAGWRLRHRQRAMG